jgi:1-acyl-sn-glycerol-3-phosphate acyltransferase
LPKGSAILAPNHMSVIDSPLILLALKKQTQDKDVKNKETTFIAKKELESNKKFSGYLGLLNAFYIDRKNPRQALKTFNEISPYLKEYKKYITIFAEGTRSKDGNMGQFKSGAFRIAKKDYLPIVPVTINNTLNATNLNRKKRLNVEIIFHPVIKPSTFISKNTEQIAKLVQNKVASK